MSSKLKFGKSSEERLGTCCKELQEIARLVLSMGVVDFSVTCGYREKEEQNKLFDEYKSKVIYPNSKHNAFPSKAMDLVPWVNGKSSYAKVHCCYLAGLVMAAGCFLGVALRWGGNWDCDLVPVTDQDFLDLVHFELVL